MESNLNKIDPNKRVQVYKNLHTGTWSVRQSGKVVAHPKLICLRDAEFRVQPAGHKKVLAEKRKNVHAYVAGFVVTSQVVRDATAHISDEDLGDTYTVVKYNPYHGDYFYDSEGNKIENIEYVDMDSEDPDGNYIIGITTG